jgi:hypothetical protein
MLNAYVKIALAKKDIGVKLAQIENPRAATLGFSFG